MTTKSEKIPIIGIGDDGSSGLSESSRKLLATADILVGPESLLSAVESDAQERWDPGGDFAAVVRRLEEDSSASIVILAPGDPLFYGIARYLCDHLGKDRFEVVPHVSSMQLAFARVKESWDDAYLCNLDSQDIQRVITRIRTAEKVGLFTTENDTPAAVAQACLDRKIDYFIAYVCENLGSPDERVTRAELVDVAAQTFSPLNVMVLVRKTGAPDRPAGREGRRLFGNPDEMFLQSKPKRGLLTPAEVRSIALAELDLGPTSIVWDVGAGSGSVAIEAAQISSAGQIFAIEMDPDDHKLISDNSDSFQTDNVRAVLGKAPEAWQDLPQPDAIFIGGTGREIRQILDAACDSLKVGGRLVVSLASPENLAGVLELLRSRGIDANCWMVQISRGNPQLGQVRFETMNPSYLVSLVKQA